MVMALIYIIITLAGAITLFDYHFNDVQCTWREILAAYYLHKLSKAEDRLHATYEKLKEEYGTSDIHDLVKKSKEFEIMAKTNTLNQLMYIQKVVMLRPNSKLVSLDKLESIVTILKNRIT